MKRDPRKLLDWRRRGAERYRDRVREETLSGERPWNTVPEVNRKRRAREFARAYGSGEYVDHLHARPCDGCGVAGYSVAAHTETGGIGYKADADTLVSLCCLSRKGTDGCHQRLDRYEMEDERPRLQALAKVLHAEFHA